MYLYLVRHGQSVGNEQKLFFGWSDHPLTQLGREQARQAAEKLKGIPFTRCMASDLSRAWETALICLEGRGVAPEPCPALREQNMGDFEDCTWQQAQVRHGDLVERLVRDWFHTTPPEGEGPEEMARRVNACVDSLIRAGEDTLVVAHNGSLSLVLKHLGLAGEGQLLRPGWFFEHGSYTAIEIENNRAVLRGFNL